MPRVIQLVTVVPLKPSGNINVPPPTTKSVVPSLLACPLSRLTYPFTMKVALSYTLIWPPDHKPAPPKLLKLALLYRFTVQYVPSQTGHQPEPRFMEAPVVYM